MVIALGRNRIIYLDIAKAICIILVVIGHYIPDNSPTWYIMLNRMIYTFHMPLFMFVSGYVYIVTKKEISYWDFLMKKVKRLMIPYFTTSVIVIAIKLLTQDFMFVENPVSLLAFFEILYLPVAGYFLWFIWALWWMFVILPFFKTKMSRDVLFLISVLLHFMPLEVTELFCLEQFSRMLVYFMFGIFVSENRWIYHFFVNFEWGKFMCATFLFISLETIYLLNLGESTDILLKNILSFIGIWFIIEVSKCISLKWNSLNKNNWLILVSISSYIIYLFHTTFEGIAKAVLHRLPFNSDLWYVFVFEAIIVISVGVIVPIIFHRWILKKYKITRILFGL